MSSTTPGSSCTMVLGGGLTGLSAAYVLTRAGRGVKVIERDDSVGGLSKTIHHNGYRFDLGGHRFFTTDPALNQFVQLLMNDELISVSRSSKILLRGRFFDYPLRPVNALFGLGLSTSLRIFLDYGFEKCRTLVRRRPCESLEDWVVENFGRTMFEIYFKVYSEKVWGIPCSSVSSEWVDRRINGLSLAKALKNAIFRMGGRNIPTLVDEFFYPKLGIGRISDRLHEEIERRNTVRLCTSVKEIHHDGSRVNHITVVDERGSDDVAAGQYISSLPLPQVIRMLRPAPPPSILEAASRLNFRDLVVVAVMVDRARVTDQTWIYIPESSIPFGRLHEPTNWSFEMAPGGKTLLVLEYFSFRGDRIWSESDDTLVALTVDHLERLGFIRKAEVLDGVVVRAPRAYPLFEIGYQECCNELYAYLERFTNFHVAGRSGMFRYYNMDHAIESGIRTAEKVIALEGDAAARRSDGAMAFAGCEG